MDSLKPVLSSFAEIKKGMDPAFGHMIFESVSESPEPSDFNDFRRIFSQHPGDVCEETCYKDESAGRLLLMVKLRPEKMESFKQKLLSVKLPEHMIIYMFSDNKLHPV